MHVDDIRAARSLKKLSGAPGRPGAHGQGGSLVFESLKLTRKEGSPRLRAVHHPNFDGAGQPSPRVARSRGGVTDRPLLNTMRALLSATDSRLSRLFVRCSVYRAPPPPPPIASLPHTPKTACAAALSRVKRTRVTLKALMEDRRKGVGSEPRDRVGRRPDVAFIVLQKQPMRASMVMLG